MVPETMAWMRKQREKRTQSPRRSKADLDALAVEALQLWIRERLTHTDIAERLGVTRQTVARWATVNRWSERRMDEARVNRERVAEDLYVGMGQAVEETYSAVTRMAARMVAYVLSGGEYCPHCGRGEDSGHPLQRVGEDPAAYAERRAFAARSATFRIRPKDVVDIMRFRMELHQAHGKGSGHGATGPAPTYPAHVVKQLADTWARVHGRTAAQVAQTSVDVDALRRRVETLEAFAERAKAEFGEERVAPLLRVA